ncbi:protein 1 [Plasmodium coatneyi]|uniref:Protein 1 n=1 Tax=Plasmodium coatneyi TaxID=208452 RepID=A0A1B1DXC2_9APIC|nr:protein 1 [Plasmodium coatneyi]ANQ07404.1 protein 1 [Plasmodium coatneyi]
MKGGIYLAAVLYLFNYLGTGHGENAEEDISKSEGKVNFFSLNSNLKRKRKSKDNRVKRRKAKFSNFLNQESYVKETDNASGEDVGGLRPSHASSFVNLNDHVNGKSSSHSVHVKESTPHSTMQRNKEKEKENEKTHGPVNSFVQSQEEAVSDDLEETHKSIIDISEKFKDDSRYNGLFDMEIDFVDLHFFNIILDLIPKDSEYHKYYENTFKQKVMEHINKLKTLIDSCISEKEQMIMLKHEINYGGTKSIETETLDEKERKLSEISKAYDNHIKSYREGLKPEINDIKNNAFSALKNSYCKENCVEYVQKYNTMRKNYITNAGKYQMKTYIYIPKSINDYSVIDKMLSEAKELKIDIEGTANSLKLLGEDIDEFSHLYKINRSLVDDAAKTLESINEEEESTQIDAQKFENNSKLLTNNYCIFEHIRKLNEPIKKTYESLIKKSNELLSSIIDTFGKSATALYKSTFDERKCYKFKTDSDKVKEEAEEICERTEKIYYEIPDDEGDKINIFYELIYPMKQYKDEIVNNSEFISNRYENIYENVKQTYEKELNDIGKLENNTVKVDLYVLQIRKINTQKTRIDESSETLGKYYEKILESKTKIYDLKIEFEKRLAKINRLQAVKSARALKEEKIKAMLEKMAKKAHYLKELLSLKEKSNVYLTEMNELLNTGSYDNLDGFSANEKARNDINALFNSVYRENMNKLIEEVENFVTKNKETTVEMPDEAVEKKLQDAKETFAKLDFVSDNRLTDVYIKMSAEVAYAEEIKKGIAQKQLENVHKKMKKFSDSFATIFDSLQNRMKQYNREKDAIENHKKNRSEKEEEYFNKVNVDEDLPKEQANVQEYTKHKQNFSRQEGEISAEITHMREVTNEIQSQLNYYGVFEKYFSIVDDQNEVSRVKILKEEIISDSLSDKVKQYEIEFKEKTSAVANIVSNIQSLNMAIDSHKRLNGSINNCNKYNEDIAVLRNKIKALQEELQKEITETEGDEVVGENTTAFLLKGLRDKMGKINEELNENKLNSLDTKKEDLLKFYSESKSKIHLSKDQNGPEDLLNRIDEWEDIKKEVGELNVNYEMISKNKVTLFKNNSVTYIEAMHSNINNIIHSITSNKNEILKSVDAIENKLNLVEQNEDYKKVSNPEKEKQIEEIRGSMSKLKELIDQHVGKMAELGNTSNSLKVNAKEKENEHNLEELNKIKRQMRDIYEQLKKISEQLKEGTVNELKEANEKVNNVELEYEKNVIEHILRQITVEKDKARKGVEGMNSLKTKIENLIHKTSNESKNELVTTSIKQHLEKANEYKNLIERNEEESINLKENAKKLETLDGVKELVQQVNMHLQSAIQSNAGISKEMNELKGVNELLISTNYSSILEYIKKNTNESVRYSELVNEEFTKAEGEEKKVIANFVEAEKLKEQIVKDLDYNDIDNKVKEIDGIKREILKMKDSAFTFWEESEKYKKMCSSYLENTKEGKKKIEYLKINGDGGKANITESQMEEVGGYVGKHEEAFKKVVEQVDKTKRLYESVLVYVTKMDNLFNQSLMKEVKVKCEKKNDEAEQIFSKIETVHGRIKAQVIESEGKIEELKEKGKIERNESTQLNDISTEAYLQIDNCRKQLDTVLSNTERVKQNALQYFNAADKSMKSVLPIRELDGENSIDKVKAAKESYEKNLETVKNEMSHIDMEEGNMNGIDKTITEIENDLLKWKIKYKEGLLKAIKEDADKKKNNFELVRSEINALINPSMSIFIKFKLKEYDMTNDLNNYGVKMNDIHAEFTKSYNLMETHLSKAANESVTLEEAQSLMEQAKEQNQHLIKREEEAITLLNDIKKVESSKLLNEMMKKVNAEYEGMTRHHGTVSQYVQEMKEVVNQMKTLNDINQCSSRLDDVVSKAKKVNESNQGDYTRDAKSMYGSMVTLANYFLSDYAKISSGMEFNEEMKSKYKTDLELEIFSVLSKSNEVLKKIEQNSNDVIEKQRESEQLVKDATDIYNVVKVKNEFNGRLEEVKNREKVISQKIMEALERLRQVEGIKCHFENFDTLLESTYELENLKKMVTIYQEKKSDAPTESALQEMDNDMKTYSNSIKELEGIVLSPMEYKEDIAKLEKTNDEMGKIIVNIRIIDSKVMDMNSTIDELYKLGKNCQSHWIAQFSYSANMETSKKSIMINKQKENTKKCIDYIGTNSSSIDNYVETLKTFYDNKLTFDNTSENVKNAKTYSVNFAKHEKESSKMISYIKKELYSFHQDSDIKIVEGKMQNILVLYDKLSDEKGKMDDLYINISETKLKQMEHSSDVFKPVIELHKSMNETNNKSLLEKQEKLKSVEDNLRHMEDEMIKSGLKYTSESVGNINKIYDRIEAEVKKLEEIDVGNSDNSQNVEEYKKQFSTLIDRTNTLMNDIEIFKKENNYNLMEENTESIDKINDYIEKITNKLANTKTEYEKTLENIKQNFDMQQNIVLKKKSIIEFSENVKKKKESIINSLYEQVELHKIEGKLDLIKSSVRDILSTGDDINEKMKRMSENIQEKKSKLEKHISIGDLDREADKIKKDVKEIEDETEGLNILLRAANGYRAEMDVIFKKMSSDRNPSAYKSAEERMNEASKIIQEIKDTIQGIDQLVKDSQNILSEINHKKSPGGRGNTGGALRNSEKSKNGRGASLQAGRKNNDPMHIEITDPEGSIGEGKESESHTTDGLTHDADEDYTSSVKGAHGLEDEETTLPTDQSEVNDATLQGHDSTGSDDLDMHAENTQDDTYEDTSYSSNPISIVLNRTFDSNKVKYAGAFILLFTSGVIGAIMANRKDDEEEENNGEEEDEGFEVKKNINVENKEEVIDVCFVDSDY